MKNFRNILVSFPAGLKKAQKQSYFFQKNFQTMFFFKIFPENVTNNRGKLFFSKKFIFTLCLFYLSCFFTLFSSDFISGAVYEEAGKPLEAVNIFYKESKTGTSTAPDGSFYLKRKTAADSLIISCLGYERRALIVKNIPADVKIFLKPTVYKAEEITFTASRIKQAGFEKLEFRKTATNSAVTKIEAVLSQINSVEVSEISGSNSRLSIRGSDSDQVQVMVDGLVINSPADGSVDLNLLNNLNIETIEIYKSGDVEKSGNSMGGLINITTKERNKESGFSGETEISAKGYYSDRDNFKISSLENYSSALNLGYLSEDRLKQINFEFSFKDFPNKWSYINASKHDIDKERKDSVRFQTNAWSKSEVYGFKYYQNDLFIKDLTFKSNLRYYRTENGLPGWIDQSFKEAYGKNKSLSGRIELTKSWQQKTLKNISYNTGFSYQEAYTFINEIYPIFHTDNQDYITSLKQNLAAEFHFIGQNWKVQLNHNLEKMNSKNLTNKQQRNIFSLVCSFKKDLTESELNPIFAHNSDYKIAMRDDYNKEQKEHLFSGSLLYNLSLNNALNPELSFSLSRNNHLPGFSDLFWIDNLFSKGNPDLKAESTNEVSASVQISQDRRKINYFISTELFYKDIGNLIIWEKKSSGKYIPENRRGGEISGLEVATGFSLLSLEVKTALNLLNPVALTDNITTNEKKIIYKPLSTLKSKLSYSFPELSELIINLNHKLTGKMYLNEENSIKTANINLVDFGFSWQLWKNKQNLKNTILALSVQNLFDEQYQIVYGYPMPGRSLTLTLSTNF